MEYKKREYKCNANILRIIGGLITFLFILHNLSLFKPRPDEGEIKTKMAFYNAYFNLSNCNFTYNIVHYYSTHNINYLASIMIRDIRISHKNSQIERHLESFSEKCFDNNKALCEYNVALKLLDIYEKVYAYIWEN